MSFGVHEERLFARQHTLDRCIEPPRCQRRVGLIRHVFLAAEGSTVGDELNSYTVVPDAEYAGDVVAIVPYALSAGVHVQ